MMDGLQLQISDRKKPFRYFPRTILKIRPHLIESLKKAVFILSAPRLPLPTSPLLVTSLFLLLSRPLAFSCLGHSPCRASHGPRLSGCALGGRAILCPCCIRNDAKKASVRKHLGKKNTHKYTCGKPATSLLLYHLITLVGSKVYPSLEHNARTHWKKRDGISYFNTTLN